MGFGESGGHCLNIEQMGFYRAIHCSAKRGLVIACHLSVCLWRWWFLIT